MNTSKVLICETQFLNREGLKSIIGRNPFYELAGDASSFDELEQRLSLRSYDIVTLDFEHDGEFGAEAISLIQENSPKTEILIISQEQKKNSIYEVLGRGINHYITKSCREDEIFSALDACRKREKYYCARILDIIINKTFREEKETPSELTQREKEVVVLIANGKQAKEISAILNISIHTIYTHRKNVMRKLKISSPVELITYAINSKLVDLN